MNGLIGLKLGKLNFEFGWRRYSRFKKVNIGLAPGLYYFYLDIGRYSLDLWIENEMGIIYRRKVIEG